ncbi:MAG: hypothetical protein AABX71_01370 [Nanoarchaeota archaeon]
MAKEKIKFIREIPPEIKEVEAGEEAEEGLEEDVESPSMEEAGFIPSRAPVLETSAETFSNLERDVESAPISATGASEEDRGEDLYQTGYETGQIDRTPPIIRQQTRDMQERGFFIRTDEIGEIKPRTIMEEPEMPRTRGEMSESVTGVERREEREGLPFERKYRMRKI